MIGSRVPPSLHSGDVLGSFYHLLYGFLDDGAKMTVVGMLSMVQRQVFENIMSAILSLLCRGRGAAFSVLVRMFCFNVYSLLCLVHHHHFPDFADIDSSTCVSVYLSMGLSVGLSVGQSAGLSVEYSEFCKPVSKTLFYMR